MWPQAVDWSTLRFGVEIEVVEGDPGPIKLLPGWRLGPDEYQFDDRGAESGGELQSPPLTWADRGQIRVMLDRLQALGCQVNWSCGLHVHVGIEPWGQAMVVPLLDAALACQEALVDLLQTPPHRMEFCPPVVPAMRERFLAAPERASLVYSGRPRSHRCGINTAAWFDYGTVEFRYANATLDYDQVIRSAELCLRFVAAVGAGATLPGDPAALTAALGAPAEGYPPPAPAPLWHRERNWLEEALLPTVGPLVEPLVAGGELLHLRPVPGGLLAAVEGEANRLTYFRLQVTAFGWQLERTAEGALIAIRRAGEADAPAIQALLHEAYAPNLAAGFNFSAATISAERALETVRTAETYLLYEGEELAGTITLWPDRSIGYFGVRPARKQGGRGHRLLQFAYDRARMKGWTTMQLDTPVTHPWLPAFYQRHGFRPVGTTHWEGKQYDSVIMVRDL